MIDRTKYVSKQLSECPYGASGVLTERTENGRVIKLETSEQVFNDAADRGLKIELAEDWLKRLDEQTPPTYSFPPHVNSIEFIELENQGPIGSCLGVSSASVADWLHWIKTGEVLRFSGFFHYLKTQQVDGLLGRDMGSVPTSGWMVGQKFGFVPEKYLKTRLPENVVRAWGGVYPPSYRDGYPYFAKLLNDEAVAEVASGYRSQSIVAIKKVDSIVKFIASGQGGVSQCSMWSGGFDEPQDRITRFGSRSRQEQHGHHAYYISGFNNVKECNVTNSWGLHWNGSDEGGKAFDRSAHQQCLDHKHTYAFGVSDMSVAGASIKPRSIQIKADDWT